MRHTLALTALAVLLVLGGCSKQKDKEAQDTTATGTLRYQCGDKEVVFTPDGDDRGDMQIANTSYAMKRAVSASGAKYENLGDDSTIFWSKGDVALVTVGGSDLPQCAPVKKNGKGKTSRREIWPPKDIRAITWRLEDLNGTGIIDNSHMTMTLGGTGGISGKGGCNNYFSGYTLYERELAIGPQIVSTQIACAPALMEQENKFTEMLVRMNSFRFERETRALILTGPDKQTLTFRRNE